MKKKRIKCSIRWQKEDYKNFKYIKSVLTYNNEKINKLKRNKPWKRENLICIVFTRYIIICKILFYLRPNERKKIHRKLEQRLCNENWDFYIFNITLTKRLNIIIMILEFWALVRLQNFE